MESESSIQDENKVEQNRPALDQSDAILVLFFFNHQ